MKPDWIDLGPLSDFVENEPTLRKNGDQRFTCVRTGDELHALEDRCPHQGYPLSQGRVCGGVLTCEWHNWKFELETGNCFFGGEPVRRFPTRIENGRVYLNQALDVPAEVRRLVASLRTALADDDAPRALREGLRLAALGLTPPDTGMGAMRMPFSVLIRDGAERAEYGFDHALALTADLCTWVDRGWVGSDEAFVLAALAVGDASKHLPPRDQLKIGAKRETRSVLSHIADTEMDDPARVTEALSAEHRNEAEVLIRAVVHTRGLEGARRALIPFVSQHLYDYGHGAIFLSKALELANRFPEAAEEILLASAVELSWATAETKLPPFTATRSALERLGEGAAQHDVAWDRAHYEAEVLAGERPAVLATLLRLEEGCDAIEILRAIGHAAALRLGRFDSTWEERLSAEVGILDVTHAVTFTEAAIAIAKHASPRDSARLAVLAAGFVGKLRKADSNEPLLPDESARGELMDAVYARQPARALGIARDFDAAARRDAFRRIAPFAALDAAVRPIFYAHTIKTTEALRRLEAEDPHADGAYLRALLVFLVPRRGERNVRRIAAVARQFMRDGRPPEGLY